MRMRRPRWMMSVALAASLTLVLAACGGEDPTPTPRPTSTPTPTAVMMAEPTATPTAMMMMEATATPTAMMMMEATATPTAMMMEATATPTAMMMVDPEVTFEGKTVRIMANSSPGGGTDTQGRVMSAFMSKYLPGNPRVIFSNNPNKPLEYVFAATQAPKDGTYISWNSTPQLNFGFQEDTRFIRRSTFEAVGSTIDSTRGWYLFDPVANLGASAANSCLWDYAGMESTGGGNHGEFILADEISDVREGNVTFLATLYAAEELGIPFKYFAFETVDTNAVRTLWAQGVINSTVRSSLWYRFPIENPDWLPTGKIRVMAGMGPGQLKANTWGEPHCGDIRDHLDDEQTRVFNSMQGPTNYASKTLWLPPGTPDNIADAVSAAFEQALTMDESLIQKYADVAGESPGWVGRDELQAATLENEALLEGAADIIQAQRDRLIAKYFPQYSN